MIILINQSILIIKNPVNEVQGVYRNHSFCPSVHLSVRLSVQICLQPITFLAEH